MLPLLAVALAGPPFAADPAGRVRAMFTSKEYVAAFAAPRAFDPAAELEIGDGNGHGFTFGWLSFRPGPGGVDVLAFDFAEERKQYASKWPPETDGVTVRHARMKPAAYAALLRDLAVVDSARLAEPPPGRELSWSGSTNDFWVSARVALRGEVLMGLDWAGYWGSRAEIAFAKPQAAATLARAAVKGLEFKAHTLTAAERAAASSRFAYEWRVFWLAGVADRLHSYDLHRRIHGWRRAVDLVRLNYRSGYWPAGSHWWVRERSIVLIGRVGDTSALPTLLDAMGRDPKDRCVYQAINAVTRLTGVDVRPRPVEEMDVEAARAKVRGMLDRRK